MMIISKFNERPKLKNTWRAMIFGLLPLLSYPLILILFVFARPVAQAIKLVSVYAFFAPVSAVIALIYGIIAYIRGERSWALWAGIIPAILVVAVYGVLFFEGLVKDLLSLFS